MKRLDIILAPIVALTTSRFLFVWTARESDFLPRAARSELIRPFVYRALLPWCSSVLAFLTRLDPAVCLALLVILSGVGLYFALVYLYHTFRPRESASIPSFLICEALLLLSINFSLPYDFATSMFFALSIALIVRGRIWTYLVLFPFATLNRETTFLLTLFWIAYSFNRMPSRKLFYTTLYQGIMWFLIHVGVMYLYADHPGSPFWWRLPDNLKEYAKHPLGTLAVLTVLAVLFYMIFRGWNDKPHLLRIAFLAMFPLQVPLHLLFGMPWEFRVYAESMCVGFLLAMWGVRGIVIGQPILSSTLQVQSSPSK